MSYESTGAAGNEGGYFRFSYRPSFDEAGKVRGIFSMATDISERRKIELELEAKQAELLRSNKDLEQFAYVASHDLKAPLRAIELLVQWITEGLAGYDANNVQENLGLLTKRTQRLNRLLDDLALRIRVPAERWAPSHGGQPRAGARRGAAAEPAADHLDLDRGQAARVQDLSGAARAGVPQSHRQRRQAPSRARKGRIVVSCEEQGDRYVFAVADDGEGIPAEYAERVFEMFQTLKPRDQVEGSGMGLAIVNRIVQWQGGRVWFEPAPGGRGTVFKFQWKKHDPLAATVETQACEAAKS